MDDKYLGGKFWSEIYFFRLKGLIHDFHRGKKKKLSPAICRFCLYFAVTITVSTGYPSRWTETRFRNCFCNHRPCALIMCVRTCFWRTN